MVPKFCTLGRSDKSPRYPKEPRCRTATVAQCAVLTCWVASFAKVTSNVINKFDVEPSWEYMCTKLCPSISSYAFKGCCNKCSSFWSFRKERQTLQRRRTCKFLKSFDGDWLNVLVPLQTLYVVAGRPLGKNCKWEGPDWYRDRALVKWLTVLQTRSRNRCEESILHEPPHDLKKKHFAVAGWLCRLISSRSSYTKTSRTHHVILVCVFLVCVCSFL